MGERGKGSQVSGGRSEQVLRDRPLLSRVFVSCSSVFISCSDRFGVIGLVLDGSIPSMGCPAFPFIGQGKARVIAEEKRRIKGRRSPSGLPGPSSSSCGSLRPYRCQQGQLHVIALSVTGATRRRRLPIMAFHSVLVDILMN